MSFAFGHLVGAWLAGKIYEYFYKKKTSHAAWFFLLLGGILPDIDFLLDWTFGYDVHRTITHGLLFLLLAPLAVYWLFLLLKNKEKKSFALLLGLGILTHFFLDSFSSHGVPLFWPSSLYFSWFNGLVPYSGEGSLLLGSAALLQSRLKYAVADMAIGTAGIFYLWFKKRIQF